MELDSLSPPAMSEDRSTSDAEIQEMLVPAKLPSQPSRVARGARKSTLDKSSQKHQSKIRKACRKTTRPVQNSNRTKRRELRSRTIAEVDPTSLTPPLITTKCSLPKELQLDDLPFPFHIDVHVQDLNVSLPAPCLVRHEMSLALRHDCESSQGATEIGRPVTVDEWIDSSPTSLRLAIATFTLNDYPILPPSSAYDNNRKMILPQRSELLLRYRVLSLTDDALFEATFAFSKDRRIPTKGSTKPKKTSNGEGKSALMTWTIDGSVRREVAEGSEYEGEVMKGLEERLKELETEWKDECVQREIINRQLSMDTAPLPLPPTGFAKTRPLISDFEDSSSGSDSSSDSDLDDKPRFRPIPKYEFVEYTTQSIPYEGTPLEVAPMLRNWEDSAWNNAKLDRAAFETTTYDPRPDDDQEKINEEQNWRDENITSKRALQGLDPGRVHRDAAALDYFLDALQIDRKELQRRMIGADGGEYKLSDVLSGEESISSLCSQFEKRLGTSMTSIRQASLLRSESSIVPPHVTLDRCQLCGNSYCQLHPPVPSFNNPTTLSHLPSSDDPDQPSCMFCGDHECTSRKSRSSQETEVINEPCLDGLAKDYPQLNICTAALIVDCSVEAILQRVPESTFLREPAAEPTPSLPGTTKNEGAKTAESFGYNPCGCTDCSQNCVCLELKAYCDKFCGCPSNCPRRFRGCKCHKSLSKGPCCEQKPDLTPCPCRRRGRVCDPLLCGSHDNCSNSQIQLQQPKAVYLGESTCPNGGYGLFILESAAPGDYIGCYAGERFEIGTNSFDSTGHGPWRLSLVDDVRISYWYNVDDNEHAIDSDLTGNLMRFINHCKPPGDNVGAAPVYIDGTHQIALHATSKLDAGDELFLNYGDSYGRLLNMGGY